jgi:hypothetical protein
MKFLSIIVCVILLVGCNTYDERDSLYNSKDYECYYREFDDFRISLYIEEGPYRETEDYGMFATLEYIGDDKEISISHAADLVGFTIVNEDGISYRIIRDAVRIDTVVKKGSAIHTNFEKIGYYRKDEENSEYWKEFYSNDGLMLPQGTYTIEVDWSFGVSEVYIEDSYEEKITISIEVLE